MILVTPEDPIVKSKITTEVYSTDLELFLSALKAVTI